jgi:hypothetical protein
MRSVRWIRRASLVGSHVCMVFSRLAMFPWVLAPKKHAKRLCIVRNTLYRKESACFNPHWSACSELDVDAILRALWLDSEFETCSLVAGSAPCITQVDGAAWPLHLHGRLSWSKWSFQPDKWHRQPLIFPTQLIEQPRLQLGQVVSAPASTWQGEGNVLFLETKHAWRLLRTYAESSHSRNSSSSRDWSGNA